jgi:ATP-dependent Clp protease ATP-binding subunit ClpC
MIAPSSELLRAVREAEDIAENTGHKVTTAHLLLALFTFPNRAALLLKERRIDEDTILDQMDGLPEEPPMTFNRLKERALELAAGAGAEEADCLHLLVALLRVRESLAYELLSRTGTSLTALRNVVVSYVTNTLPRRFLQMPETEPYQALQKRRVVGGEEAAPAPRMRPSTRVAELVKDPVEYAEDEPEERPVAKAAPAVKAAPAAAPSVAPAAAPDGTFELDAREFPLLSELGRNLCKMALDGGIDDLIGRTRELSQVIDVLGRRRANNPCLVGPPGVGKTAIVEGLALAIVRGGDDVSHLRNKIILDLPMGSILSGTSLRGALSEKLAELQSEVKRANGRVIVFIDELHTLIGAGSSGDGAQDVANELKAGLARGEFPCIGATTDTEYKKYIEQDPAIERRFTPVEVKEPTVDEAVLMLEGAIAPYAEHHGVTYSVDALQAACAWSHKFIAERKLPDKAFSIVDLAGSRARRHSRPLVTKREVAEIVSELSGVPRERLEQGDMDKLARLEETLGRSLHGQAAAVSAVAQAIRRGFAGFARHRPVASLMFLGSTGVGKTELAKVLAELLFGRRDALVRIDLSEYVEAHSLAKLVGAPPGYVGFGEGGQLTEAVRKRPFQVILFDEFEKAHPDVRNVLLQILDDGRLTDSKGRTVRFVDTVIVLTSNAGCAELHRTAPRIGFGDEGALPAAAAITEQVKQAARHSFAPELWNRIDEKIVFLPLGHDELVQIARHLLDDLSQVAFSEREVSLTYSTAALRRLAELSFDRELGARPLRQNVQRLIEAPFAEKILGGELAAGDSVHLDIDGEGFIFDRTSARRA